MQGRGSMRTPMQRAKVKTSRYYRRPPMEPPHHTDLATLANEIVIWDGGGVVVVSRCQALNLLLIPTVGGRFESPLLNKDDDPMTTFYVLYLDTYFDTLLALYSLSRYVPVITISPPTSR